MLGLDPGSIRFGYGLVTMSGANLSYGECGVLSAPERWPLSKRLAEIGARLEEVLRDLAPEEAAIESGFVKQPKAALIIGCARGVGHYLCGVRGIVVAEHSPSSVKQAVTASGKASKEMVQRCVKMRLRMSSTPAEDAADALAVAICHACLPRPRV